MLVMVVSNGKIHTSKERTIRQYMLQAAPIPIVNKSNSPFSCMERQANKQVMTEKRKKSYTACLSFSYLQPSFFFRPLFQFLKDKNNFKYN
jgi:hypothetical protein